MRVEQRDPTLQPRRQANQQWEELVSEAKPYDIPKRLVWEAYQRVKANRGAAGVDGVSLAAFEQNLKGNLYKIWNRMSSGSINHRPCASSRYRRIRAVRADSAFRRRGHRAPHAVSVGDDGRRWAELTTHSRRRRSNWSSIVMAYGAFGLRCAAGSR